MLRFKFRLDAVQRLRLALEKEAMADLARALGRVREVEIQVDTIAAERRDVLARIDHRLGSGDLDVRWIERHHLDLARLDESDVQTRDELAVARGEYDEARARLGRRQADRKAMDVLEDKARMRHDEEVRREEHAVMDEIAMQRHGTRSYGGQ